MAGGEERTEQASPRKRKEEREKGRVAKSSEVNAAVGLLAVVVAFRAVGGKMVQQWQEMAAGYLGRTTPAEMSIPFLQQEAMRVQGHVLLLLLPMLSIVMVCGLASNLLQVGILISAKPVMPDFSRINPAQGFARIFSKRSLVEMVKSMLKAFLLGVVVFGFFRQRGEAIVGLAAVEEGLLAPTVIALCWELLVKATLVLAALAAADYLYQRWEHEKSLKMTKQETKEEYKRLEGDPLIKSRIRQQQRQLARSRMMAEVPKATVVVTNPTHVAVALRYEPTTMAAPTVVAKGQELVAARIKEIAREHRVPIVENRPLARALYAQCALGQLIPAELFQAVAEIIAFVYRQSGRAPEFAREE